MVQKEQEANQRAWLHIWKDENEKGPPAMFVTFVLATAINQSINLDASVVLMILLPTTN